MADNFSKLSLLLSKSHLYSNIIAQKLEKDRQKAQEQHSQQEQEVKEAENHEEGEEVENEPASVGGKRGKKRKKGGGLTKSRKKARVTAPVASSTTTTTTSSTDSTSFRSRVRSIVPGAILKSYQLSGVEWLLSLFENGFNGILADEMGLGKTLQTISFIAYLRDRGLGGPILVVCPLSTLGNWMAEFERFCPELKTVKYHGSPAQREEMRGDFRALKRRESKEGNTLVWPVIVTTYELVMRDRKYLNYNYQYVIVDESHRLKNMNCKLIRELKTYSSENRLLLTGTPLQNNLAELWSLLNYILPQIFDDLDTFTSWFNFTEETDEEEDANENTELKTSDSADSSIPISTPNDDGGLNDATKDNEAGETSKTEMTSVLTQKQSNAVIEQLHKILQPFLLRRLKSEVERDMPKKKEYLLSAPLTERQKELYDAVITGELREILVQGKLKEKEKERDREDEGDNENGKERASVVTIASSDTERTPRPRRARKMYEEVDFEDMSEKKFLKQLNKEALIKEEEERVRKKNKVEDEVRKARKEVNSMKLQNMVMQLRKICNHPWLMDWPKDDEGLPCMNEDLVNASGKMFLLDRLLDRLFSQNHKVLLFSQFTSMLDIIEDWAVEIKSWPRPCRIDGTTKQDERVEMMRVFTEGSSNNKDDPMLFLLSTRAGGMGINLTAADTVILFDSDWNPTVDMQAIDRSHRIGQTRPVLVFRLVCGSTVESKMLKKAGMKRKLGHMVIERGNFKLPTERNQSKLLNMDDDEALLGLDDIKLIDKQSVVMTDEQLEMLLDRSEQAMEREKSWKVKGEEGTEIEVFEREVGGNEGLGTVMSS